MTGVMVAKRKTVLVSCDRVSTVPTVTGMAGIVIAKRRTVVTFGLVSCDRVSKVRTVTGMARVVIAKRRTVVTFGLVFCDRVSEVQQSQAWWGRGRENFWEIFLRIFGAVHQLLNTHRFHIILWRHGVTCPAAKSRHLPRPTVVCRGARMQPQPIITHHPSIFYCNPAVLIKDVSDDPPPPGGGLL